MPRVLIVDGEEWVAEMLAEAAREAGYEVTVCHTAQEGFAKATAAVPDCIVCDVALPDHDGFWVAKEVRALSGPASLTPFLFLSKVDHPKARMQGYQVGGDVYMTKPFRLHEVLAQLAALMQMGARLREVRKQLPSAPPPAGGAAMAGELSQASISTVLTVLEMEARTGTFEIVRGDRRWVLELERGAVMSGSIDGAPAEGLVVLRAMLAVGEGRFTFHRADREPETRSARADSVGRNALGSLLMQAMRIDDKAQPLAITPTPMATPAQEAHARPPPREAQAVTARSPAAAPKEPTARPPAPRPGPPAAQWRASIPEELDDVDLVDVEPDLSSYRPPPAD